MECKGDLIFWEISSELNATKAELAEMGFERCVPRNDFKAAMVKALMLITRGNEKLYRRFNDNSDSVSFGVFHETVENDEISLDKELIIILNKNDGLVEFSNRDNPLVPFILDSYMGGKETLDARQIRAMLLKIVKNECFGIPMRSGGGIYFLDRKIPNYAQNRKKIQSFFDKFPLHTTLHTVPIYENEETSAAIEYAVKDDIFGDIDELVSSIDKRFKDGSITKRQLDGDKERASKILEKIRVHRDNLRLAAAQVSAKLLNVSGSIENLVERVENGLVEPDDFAKMLESL
jgi:hypothetical protein